MAKQRPIRGLTKRSGKRAPGGWMLAARNSRYIPGDKQTRLWSLLGRSAFATSGLSNTMTLDDTIKTLFPFYVDGGTSKLWCHQGGLIREATIGATGSFTDAYTISETLNVPRGTPVGYHDNVYYPIGANAWDTDHNFIVRTTSGWRKGGHRTPTAGVALTLEGSGSYGSATDIQYFYRIYDSTTDTVSAHSPAQTLSAPGVAGSTFRWTFGAGVTTNGELGTHVQLYRTLVNETPGLAYRVDGTGSGIALADVVAGYTFDEALTNLQAQINGLVRADGIEGTNTWAEHGGPPPNARGAIIFNDHLVLYGIPDRPLDIIYSARGYPEAFPVNFAGSYEYYLVMSSSKQDKVLCCRPAGNYLMCMTQNAIFRVALLPTYAQAGFDRLVQDTLQDEHGIVGPYAADSFGVGEEESQWLIYVSREHGPSLTNGITADPIVLHAGWKNLVNRAYLSECVVTNYPEFQEAWIFYTPKGGTENTQAIIVDYSAMDGAGLRVTGPVDVKANTAVFAWDDQGEPRFYLAQASSNQVYVQDSGAVDAQQNYNTAGDIKIEWETPRLAERGSSKKTMVRRTTIEGQSGTAKLFDVTHYAIDGIEEYSVTDKVQIGPGETEDDYMANLNGRGHRTRLDYAGPTGSTYDEDDSNCAPCLASVDHEDYSGGRQTRTRNA